MSKKDVPFVDEFIIPLQEHDIDNLIENRAWMSIEQMLRDRIDVLIDDLINVDDPLEMKEYQGRLREDKLLLEVPRLLVEEVKEKNRRKHE